MDNENMDQDNDAIISLINMFKDVMNEDAIRTIFESYEGDLNQSVEAIMNITNDGNTISLCNQSSLPVINSHMENAQSAPLMPFMRPVPSLQMPYAQQQMMTSVTPDALRNSPQLVQSHNPPCTNQTFPVVENPENFNRPQMLLSNINNLTSEPQNSYPQMTSTQKPSYAYASQKTGAIPKKKIQKPSGCGTPMGNTKICGIWTPQVKSIIFNHNKGSRIAIIMRGLPGSGKTFLAKRIIEMTIGNATDDYKAHIFSTDDFFYISGEYKHNKFQLGEAHIWNQCRVHHKMIEGVSPIIIDNTNVEIWEMEPYVRSGVSNGYIIEVLEPETPWAKNPYQLAHKNTHNVGIDTIKRRLSNYQDRVSGKDLLKYFKLSYPTHLKPPVLRNIPAIHDQSEYQSELNNSNDSKENIKVQSMSSVDDHVTVVSGNFSSNQKESSIDSFNNQSELVIQKKAPKKNVFQILTETLKGFEDSRVDQHSQLRQEHNTFENKPEKSFKEDNPQNNQPKDQHNMFGNNPEESFKEDNPQNNQPNDKHNMFGNNPEESFKEDNPQPKDKHNMFENNPEECFKEDNLQNNESKDKQEDDFDTKQEDDFDIKQDDKYSSLEKQFKETIKVEEVWEDGEAWTEVSQQQDNLLAETDPQPPRQRTISNSSNNSIKDELNTGDWSKISLFMSPWSSEVSPNSANTSVAVVHKSEKKSCGTCMELGDADSNNIGNVYKVLISTPRDINLYYIPSSKTKIPEKWMLDKSTVTNESEPIWDSKNQRCVNEEKHFKLFRKLFKNIPKSVLRDIFDQCCGDVNWAVQIVLDGVTQNQFKMTDNSDVSDSSSDSEEHCTCLAAYDIIPNTTSKEHSKGSTLQETDKLDAVQTSGQQRKLKKNITTTEESYQLKQQIEKNVVISDNHYSQHCLNIRKIRRGEHITPNTSWVEEPSKSTDVEMIECLPSTSKEVTQLEYDSNNEEYLSDNSSSSENEKTVIVTLGKEIIAELDRIFGRDGMIYPDYVVPKIMAPLSLLNELNALWMESFMGQVDDQSRQTELMIKQDEELARKLAAKEAELAQEGKEPEVPDFKEIMDMDFALSVYQKYVHEWRDNEPTDLAAKMTRQKLYNLFPDMNKDLLCELLMAYNNEFQSTVEALLVSTGKADIVAQKNGIAKFVMDKEMEQKEKIMAKEKGNLSENDWPLLPKEEKLSMETVQEYREEAAKHLKFRNDCFMKAQDYLRRGMTQVASYYSDVASYHKTKYDKASSLAAVSLVHVHASKANNNSMLNLHYLHVKEALESLDLFVDMQIRKLLDRGAEEASAPGATTLYLITGRGLHSAGMQPRIKPAVKRRLRERGLRYNECNPGLLTTRVTANCRLTHQLP